MKSLIIKYNKLIKYGLGGAFTTILHLLLFWILIKVGIKYSIANIITLIVIKSLAYFVNKLFVFKSKCSNTKELLSEVFKYIITRLFTMVLDYYLLIMFVEVVRIDVFISKIVVLVIVVIINYILCNKVVYKKVSK